MQRDLLALAEADPIATPAKLESPSTPVVSPRDEKTDKDMEAELNRIQGILGSVIKKRRDERSTDAEVKLLRAQLEKQEETVSLRKADAAFLQRQLEEKDDLLQEVSKLLEAVEIRQSELERENQRLRLEVETLKASQSASVAEAKPAESAPEQVTTTPETKNTEEADLDDLDDLLGPVQLYMTISSEN